MKKIINTLLVCVLLASIIVLTGCDDNTTEKVSKETVKINDNIVSEIKDKGYITVGCKEDVPGLGLHAKNKWSGLEVDLAYKVAAKIWEVTEDEAKEKNLVKFVGVRVDNREQMLQTGKIDLMLATYTITKERQEKFSLSDSYYTDYIGMMVVKVDKDNNSIGNKGINSIADIDGKYIGVPRKATTRKAFIKYINTIDAITVNPIFCEYESYEQLYKALKTGKIDIMAVDKSILNGYADKNTKILDESFGAQRYGAASKLENKKLIDIVNQVL